MTLWCLEFNQTFTRNIICNEIRLYFSVKGAFNLQVIGGTATVMLTFNDEMEYTCERFLERKRVNENDPASHYDDY